VPMQVETSGDPPFFCFGGGAARFSDTDDYCFVSSVLTIPSFLLALPGLQRPADDVPSLLFQPLTFFFNQVPGTNF